EDPERPLPRQREAPDPGREAPGDRGRSGSGPLATGIGRGEVERDRRAGDGSAPSARRSGLRSIRVGLPALQGPEPVPRGAEVAPAMSPAPPMGPQGSREAATIS